MVLRKCRVLDTNIKSIVQIEIKGIYERIILKCVRECITNEMKVLSLFVFFIF